MRRGFKRTPPRGQGRPRRQQARWPLSWRSDQSQPNSFRFKGYEAVYTPSSLGNYQRLAYDRSQPWEKDIPYFDRFVEDAAVAAPKAYLVPQAWREVIERLEWNGVAMRRLEEDQLFDNARVYRIERVASRPGPYEGRMFHDEVTLVAHAETVHARAGDVWISLAQPKARYIVETLEPEAHDSFFRWGFFNSVLEKKEFVFRLRVRRHGAPDAGRRAGAESRLRGMEEEQSRQALRSARSPRLHLCARPDAWMAALRAS
jgi:hypothetical protein